MDKRLRQIKAKDISLWTFHLFQHVQNNKQQVQTAWQFDFFHYFQPFSSNRTAGKYTNA